MQVERHRYIGVERDGDGQEIVRGRGMDAHMDRKEEGERRSGWMNRSSGVCNALLKGKGTL